MKQKQLGILYILCAAFCFALMNLFVRLSGDLPVMQKSLFRNLVAAGIAFGMILKSREKVRFRTEQASAAKNIGCLLVRATAGTVGILCNFFAVGALNIADASMLNKLSPFFAIIFSIFVLKEKPKKKEWLAVLIAFVGALFVVKPSFQMESIPALIGLCGGLFAGLAYTFVRKLGQNGIKGNVIVFFFSVFSCVVVLPGVILQYQPMTVQQLVFLLLAGVSAAGGQFAITAAYTKAPAKEISVFDYTQVIFAAVLSLIVLGELPDVYSFIGYAIIIGTAVVKARENQKENG
ncbi:MAG: DMT family transporter [Roseburia sp.]